MFACLSPLTRLYSWIALVFESGWLSIAIVFRASSYQARVITWPSLRVFGSICLLILSSSDFLNKPISSPANLTIFNRDISRHLSMLYKQSTL